MTSEASDSNETTKPSRPQPWPPHIEVYGWASTNHADVQEAAVVVNSMAMPLTLLSWGFGQLQQLNVALDDLCHTDGSTERSHRTLESLLHFSMQAEIVLRAGIERLREAEMRKKTSPY